MVKKDEESTEKMIEETTEDNDKLPFPMATVVRHIKTQAKDKMVSSKVKLAMNEFLGDMVALVSRDMAQTRYSMIEMDDFHRATKAYVSAKEFELEKERVVKELETIRSKIESMIREFQRTFSIKSADDVHVIDLDDQPIIEEKIEKEKKS